MMPTTTYRIYTEDLKNGHAEHYASKAFQAFTIIRGEGYWEGKREDSLIIEILTDDGAAVQALAEKIRSRNKQDAVLVTRTATVATLVEAGEAPIDGLQPTGEAL